MGATKPGEEGEDDEPSGMGVGSGVVATPQKATSLNTSHHVVAACCRRHRGDALPDGLSDPGPRWWAPTPAPTCAAMKIRADQLAPITFGNSDDLQIGDAVLALANFGDGQTVTGHHLGAEPHPAGPVHLRELHPDRRRHQPRQIPAAPLSTLRGRHGHRAICTRAYGSIDRFAIPVSTARQVMEQIIKDGRVG